MIQLDTFFSCYIACYESGILVFCKFFNRLLQTITLHDEYLEISFSYTKSYTKLCFIGYKGNYMVLKLM